MGPILSKWNHFLEVTFPLRPKVSSFARSLPTVVNGKPITAAGAVGLKGSAPIIPGISSRTGGVSITALAKRVGCDQAVMAPTGVRSADSAKQEPDANLIPFLYALSWFCFWVRWASWRGTVRMRSRENTSNSSRLPSWPIGKSGH